MQIHMNVQICMCIKIPLKKLCILKQRMNYKNSKSVLCCVDCNTKWDPVSHFSKVYGQNEGQGHYPSPVDTVFIPAGHFFFFLPVLFSSSNHPTPHKIVTCLLKKIIFSIFFSAPGDRCLLSKTFMFNIYKNSPPKFQSSPTRTSAWLLLTLPQLSSTHILR